MGTAAAVHEVGLLGGTGGSIDHDHAVAGHVHDVPGHRHGLGSLATNDAGNHNHAAPNGGQFLMTNGPFPGNLSATSGAYTLGPVTENGGAHGHSFSGVVGATAGANGDATFQTAPQAATTTASNNPPFMSLNYIIKN